MKGWWKMGRFNLLYEPWISVMTDNKGKTEEVSLLDLFKNAHKYYRLAGETPAQDFAILRFLLAIMHTVFSRFDAEGEKIEWIDLDERFVQIDEVDEDDLEEYEDALMDSWKELWDKESLPNIINDYLEVWEDHFNLYDEKYPFYQVTKEDLEKLNISEKGEIKIKLINRLLSESNNKIELFSPYSKEYKNKIFDSSFARWLISFQGYTGTADKKKHPLMKEKKISASKGWLLGLGGIYLEGNNIKETLLLNMIRDKGDKIQKPLWEKELQNKVSDLLESVPNNLSELYTVWSRLVFIEQTDKAPESIYAVQLPGIDPKEFFLEPMTLWQCPKSGENKDRFIPRTHNSNQSFWRSFGQVALSDNEKRKPGIVDWHNEIVKCTDLEMTKVVSVGLDYNRDASTMLNNEIYDVINIHDEVLADVEKEGWAERITLIVEKTKEVISFDYKNFLQEINKIRNLNHEGFVDTAIQEAYFNIDLYFREWLVSITLNDEKDGKQKEWEVKLKELMREESRRIVKNASKRDFLGKWIEQKGKKEPIYSNISIAQNIFSARLNKKLIKQKGGKDENSEI